MMHSFQEWERIRDEVASELDAGDPVELLERLEHLVCDEAEAEIARDLHSLRGELQMRCGRKDLAEESFRKALIHTKSALYAKYVIELRLGDLTGDSSWYVESLRTARAHGGLPCGGALVALLEQSGKSESDFSVTGLLDECIRMSWHALRLPGEPDIDKLTAANRILAGEGGGS